MTLINCGVKLRPKKESLQIMRERFEQLTIEKKFKTAEYKMLKNILEPRK